MWSDVRNDKIRCALNVFLRAKDMTAIDHHLARLRLAELSCEEMLTYLRTLKDAADELTQYWLFFARVRDALSSRGHLRCDTFSGCLPSTPGGLRTPDLPTPYAGCSAN